VAAQGRCPERQRRAELVGPVDGRRPGLRKSAGLMALGWKEAWPSPERMGSHSERVGDRGRQWSFRRVRVWPTTPARAAPVTNGALRAAEGGGMGHCWCAQRQLRHHSGAETPATAIRHRCERLELWATRRRRRGSNRVAADIVARAASLRVGDPRSSRDN
jgi:hypothetical protein